MTDKLKYSFRYLPISDEVRQRGMYVIAGGYTLIPPNSPYPPTKHPDNHQFTWNNGRRLSEYAIQYITRGQGVFESDATGSRRIKAGDLFLLFPGVWHRYSPDVAEGWDEYWVTFDGKQAGEIMADLDFSPENAVLTPGFNETLF